MKILYKIIIILFLFVSFAKAQAPQWRVYTPQNSGLPYPSVRSLAVEKDSMRRNIIWIGVGGLTKFDGLNWTVYNSSNSGMVGGAWTIALDKSNAKCIGTYPENDGRGGVVKFDNINWSVYDTSNSPLPAHWIWNIFVDEFDIKWIGTAFGGLAKLKDTTWTIYNIQNSGIPENRIRALNSEEFIKWIGTAFSGIAKFNDIIWTVYNSTNSGLTYDRITDIDIDIENNKWISTFGGGLNKFNSIDNIWNGYLSQGFLNCLIIDDANNIKWMGSPGGGSYLQLDTNAEIFKFNRGIVIDSGSYRKWSSLSCQRAFAGTSLNFFGASSKVDNGGFIVIDGNANLKLGDNTTLTFDSPNTYLLLKPNSHVILGQNSKLVFKNGAYLKADGATFNSYDNSSLWEGIVLENSGIDSIINCTFSHAKVSITVTNLQNNANLMRVFKNNSFNIPSGNFTYKGIYGESNNQILIQNNIFTSSSGSGQAGLELRNYPPGNSMLYQTPEVKMKNLKSLVIRSTL